MTARPNVLTRMLLTSATWSAVCASVAAQSTYYIEEISKFPPAGAECSEVELNYVTPTLASELASDGWSGNVVMDAQSAPEHFRDRELADGGEDELFADGAAVTVYAGHGRAGEVRFPSGTCTATTSTDMRLGAGTTGGQSTLAVWLACDVLAVDPLGGPLVINNVRQQLGWMNSISIDDDEPRKVYAATKSQSNADTWLNLMGGPGGYDAATRKLDERRPIVVTMTDVDSEEDCWAHHERQAWGQEVVEPMQGEARHVCWEYLE